MFKLTFVIFAVIWTVSSAVVGKDLSKDTAKKTKFNLDPILMKNARAEGDLLLKENLRNLFFPSSTIYDSGSDEMRKKRYPNIRVLRELDDLLRLSTAPSKSSFPFDFLDVGGGGGSAQINEGDWSSSTGNMGGDDADDEGIWSDTPMQPGYEFLQPKKRFAPNTKSFKALGPAPPPAATGHRSYYYQ